MFGLHWIFLLIFWHFQNVSTSFHAVMPILWEEDSTLVSNVNKTEIFSVMDVPYPCTSLENKKLQDWCNDELENTIFFLLRSTCKPNLPKSHTRTKRRSKRFAKLIKTGINIMLTESFDLINKVKSWITNNTNQMEGHDEESFQKMESKLNHMIAEIKKLQSADLKKGTEKTRQKIKEQWTELENKFPEEINRLQSQLNDIVVNLAKKDSRVSSFLKSPNNMHATSESEVKTILENARPILMEFKQDWSNGVVNSKIFSLMGVDMDPYLLQAYKTGKPKRCYLDDYTKKFYIFVETQNIDFGLKTLKANPFTFYEPINDANFVVKIEYVGPPRVIYDPENNCILPYNDQDVFFLPTKESCKKADGNSHLQYWKKSCQRVHYKDENSPVQVKLVDDNRYYIYCAGSKIRAYDKIVDCPNFVFSLPKDDLKEIIGKEKIDKMVHSTERSHLLSNISQKVSYTLMPNIARLQDLSTVPMNETCGSFPWTYAVLGLLVLVILVVLGAVYFNMQYTRNRISKSMRRNEPDGSTLDKLNNLGSSRNNNNNTNNEINNNIPLVSVNTKDCKYENNNVNYFKRGAVERQSAKHDISVAQRKAALEKKINDA